MNQIELHKAIENTLANEPRTVKTEDVSGLIKANLDAKQYFFSKADERWLDWLWEYGFLDTIKEKAPDPSSYGFRMPELNYLVSLVEKKPNVITDIICSFEILPNNFNPEVVDQFTRIASNLSARYLKKVVKKIKDEEWVRLMGGYTQYGFEYAGMLETLHKDGDFKSILVLAEAILLIRSKKDIKERKISYKGDDIFYIHDLSETKVFTYLAEIPDKYLEQALSIVIRVFNRAIEDEGNYLLMDEDLFALSLSGVTGYDYREEFKFLAATIIELVKRIFSSQDSYNKKIYNKYFAKLPQNQITRRLNLFVLSLDPKLFIQELRTEYFKLFKAKKPLEVLLGAEYERSLKAGFSFLTDKEKRDYVDNIFRLFTKFEDEDDKRWKRHYASCILSTISKNLTNQEVALAEKNEFKIDPNYQPEPSIGRTRSGTVTPRSPINSDDFSKLTIMDIASKLKNDLTPHELQKKYKNDDFLNPRDADGVAAQLKGDIKNRLVEYLNNAPLFFDRDKLIPHYTNAYLQGIKDSLSQNKTTLENINFDDLFKLLQNIKNSGEVEPFNKTDKDTEGRWLSNWNSAHSTIADLIEELIKEQDKKTLLDFKEYRERVLEILEYLFNFNDPIPEDEKLKTARSTIKRPGESEYSISDPFTIAINSVRGRTFQTLLHFIYQDVNKNEKTKISEDVKFLYNKLIEKENTRAIMFMFGHYLPSFHYRDMDWTRSKFNEIFESERKDKYLHLATWEGYLSNNLYRELFFEPYIQKLYGKNITVNLLYPKQKFFKDPHESLAIHLALAFVNYEEFNFENPLFKKFVKEADTKQLSEFISFLGRSYITGENYTILKETESPWRLERVKDFWDLMLKIKSASLSLTEFGTWIDAEKEIFEVKWLAKRITQTLETTNGALEWDYGLTTSIEKLASQAPKDALKILEKHFLSEIGDKQNYIFIQADKEWYSAFKILYSNSVIKNETYNLINKLIEKGGRQFWILEDIIK